MGISDAITQKKVSTKQSHLTNTRSGVKNEAKRKNKRERKGEGKPGGRSLAAPSAVIYDMPPIKAGPGIELPFE